MEEREKILIHGLSAGELTAIFTGLGEPAFRTSQVWKWLYVQRVSEWAGMRNVPTGLREKLAAGYGLEPVKRLEVDGEPTGTRKILVGLRDGDCVEEVLIPSGDRMTVCVSSQVGCRFACAFCASGKGGFVRNLEVGEIVGQVLLAYREYGNRPSNIVFMGMGEPFDNYESVLKAIRILNDQDGLVIGARHITISTSGVIPGIERLAGEGLQVELSVSLHAPDNELRDRLMPINRRYPLKDLLEACRRYADGTRRIVTFEYTLIGGVNDSRHQAELLVRLLKPLSARVNLIPLSPVQGYSGEAPAPQAADMFIKVLEQAGINVTLRASKGGEIEAACGQLRRRHVKAARAGEEDRP
jgi:23S rRNA (adenine2503-C2)-methyltransferase